MRTRRPSLSSAVLAACTLVACHGSDAPAATAPTPSSTTSTAVPAAADDGVLVVGAVLPSGGAAADMGVSMRAALRLAVNQVNDAGGVNGSPLRLEERDEGDSTATALAAVQDLVKARADVVIGPTSSLNLLATLSTTVAADVLTCSPTGTALALDDFPARGLLVRTVPSDSLQAAAIARTVDESGGNDAVVVYLDDAFGRPLGATVAAAMRARGTTVTGEFGFEAGKTPDPDTIAAITALDPDTVVVVADGATGPTIVTSIDDATVGAGPLFVVNDAMRRPDAATAPYSKALANRVLGVSALAYSDSPSFTKALKAVDADATGLYAANAYDCLTLVALAANTATTDDAQLIAAAIPGLSTGGSSCATYVDCTRIAGEGRNPNYEGPNGALAIDENGMAVAARFEKFGFDPATGRDVHRQYLTVGNS